MNKGSDTQKETSQTNTQGEQERDNDAHRPDGSTGTAHDSTAQKTARNSDRLKR
ncbi:MULTISPECIES: hypothetical protein [Pseudomonas]|uniref:hypothetical protein n=1 Tax=Pseudomonas TaxID=286 RepID=UPI000AFC072B|nr:hypothetical protein [Pseudomonas monteilii]